MHYLTFVLVPQSAEKFEIPDLVADMLAPYYVLLFPEDYDGCYPPNPRAQWDYCCIGGRWDGLISGHSIDEFLPADEGWRVWERNIARVRDLLPSFLPAAIITPDGLWHDWYEDTETHLDDEWEPIAKSILEAHSDCSAVCIDCHSW